MHVLLHHFVEIKEIVYVSWYIIFIKILYTCRDLSNNNLSGEVPSSGSFSLFTPIRCAAKISHEQLGLFIDYWPFTCNFSVLQITLYYVVLVQRSRVRVLHHFLHHLLLIHRNHFLPKVTIYFHITGSYIFYHAYESDFWLTNFRRLFSYSYIDT